METYTIVFTTQQLSVIDAALQEMPFRIVAPVVKDINQQIMEQRLPENITAE